MFTEELYFEFTRILIICLKRWDYMGNKINKKIEVPLDIDLSQVVNGYNSNSYKYNLYGVYNHFGGNRHGGHYTCNIKNANGKWYTFNDTQVNEINDRQVVSDKAYCFFYRKKK